MTTRIDQVVTTRTRSPRRRRPPKGRARRQWHFDPGSCFVCCCTDDDACPGGCYWVDPERTICSVCAAELGLLFIAWLRRRR